MCEYRQYIDEKGVCMDCPNFMIGSGDRITCEKPVCPEVRMKILMNASC